MGHPNLFKWRVRLSGHHRVKHSVDKRREKLLEKMCGTPLPLHKTKTLAAMDATCYDMRNLLGSHHLRLVAWCLALL